MAQTTTVVGLDIGRHSVKAVRATEHRGKVSVQSVDLLRIPSDVANKNDVISPWLTKLGLHKLPCAIGIPGQQVMFQPLQLPPNDPRPTSQAVAMEVSRFNDMASETMIYDFASLADTGEDGERVLLSMARPAVLSEEMMLPQGMRLQVADMVPSPVAAFIAVQDGITGLSSPFVCVDIGHSGTQVAVGSGAGLMFARSFATGGQAFTDALAEATELPQRHAEDQKVAGASLTEGDDATREALTEAADTWLSEFDACMSVYRSSYTQDTDEPGQIVCTGGGAMLKGLPEYIASRTGMNLVTLESLPVAGSSAVPCSFAIATGLAIAGLQAAKTHISLLPQSIRQAIMLQRQKKFWVAAAAAAALLLAVNVLGGYRDIEAQRERLTRQSAVLKRCEQLAGQIEASESANQQILKMAAPVERLVRNGPFMRRLLALLATEKDKNDCITMVCDAAFYIPREELLSSMEPKDKTDKSKPATRTRTRRWNIPTAASTDEAEDKAPKDAFQSVIVEGYTPMSNLSTVDRLIAVLNNAPFVEHADLLGDDKIVFDPDRDAGWRETRMRRFVIQLTQVPPEKEGEAALLPIAKPPRAAAASRPPIMDDEPQPPATDTDTVPISIDVTASSTHRGEAGEATAAALIDRDLFTRWSSDYSTPQKVILKLSRSARLSRMRIHWEIAAAKSYSVSLSPDGTTWTKAFQKRKGEMGPRIDDIDLGGQEARRIRIDLRGRMNPTWGFSIYEIEVVTTDE